MDRLGCLAKSLLPLVTALLAGCGTAKEVVAWPGMDAAEFNRLNRTSAAPLKLRGSDWIGINSPVTLVIPHGKEAIRFSGSRLGGGAQVASSDLGPDGIPEKQARVRTIAFNIGGSMEDLTAQEPLLAAQCVRLARLAGLTPKPFPRAAELRTRLRNAHGGDVEICGGEGASLTFQITAAHKDDDRSYGSDYNRAYLDGSVSLTLR
jgi:hypothetical protein